MRRLVLLTLLAAACNPPAQPPAPTPQAPQPRLLADARTLADPKYEGRAAGTPGAASAAAWIQGRMKEIGLTHPHLQPFTSAGVSCKNVVGEIPGRRPDRVIVIGAHYDHLGIRPPRSAHGEAVGDPALHPGADDNASGVAALLEAARQLALLPQPSSTVAFVAFSGEEIGCLGSAHYARTVEARMVAMLNMDMVGRLGKQPLIVGGVATGTGFRDLVEKANKGGAPLTLKDGGTGPSDYKSFFEKDVPVLWFTSGTHADWDKPTDTVGKLDEAGMKRTADLLVRCVLAIDAMEPPEFHRVNGEEAPSSGERKMVKLGTIPDYAYQEGGVLFADVRDDGAAALGGIMKGDVLISLAGRPVENVEEFTAILRELETDQAYPYTVMRDGGKVSGKVTPTKRW